MESKQKQKTIKQNKTKNTLAQKFETHFVGSNPTYDRLNFGPISKAPRLQFIPEYFELSELNHSQSLISEPVITKERRFFIRKSKTYADDVTTRQYFAGLCYFVELKNIRYCTPIFKAVSRYMPIFKDGSELDGDLPLSRMESVGNYLHETDFICDPIDVSYECNKLNILNGRHRFAWHLIKFKKYILCKFTESCKLETFVPCLDQIQYTAQSVAPTFATQNALKIIKEGNILVKQRNFEGERVYIFVDFNRKVANIISLKEFNRLTGSVYQTASATFKFKDVDKHTAIRVCRMIKPFYYLQDWTYTSQSYYEDILNTISGLKMFMSSMRLIGSIKNEVVKHGSNMSRLTLDIVSVLLKIYKIYCSSFSVSNVIDMCIELARTYLDFNSLANSWYAESYESLLCATASLFLPKSLMEIIKRMSLFSSAKLCDDSGAFVDFFQCVVSYFEKLVSYLPFEMPQVLKNLFSFLSNTTNYAFLHQIKNVYATWQKDKKIILDNSFRAKVLDLKIKLDNNSSLVDWSKRSAGISAFFLDFNRLAKAVLSYNSSSRIEPSCYIFEGKPGTKKSVTVNRLTAVLGESTYVHHIKATEDGKDFYDGYNDEEITILDDLGQQGPSQYRTLINMVSPVKLPLECAEAKLKDTKFFSSNKILVTTNCFTNLNGLTKTDCISDITALWRRGYVFSYNEVYRHGIALSGTVKFLYFNTNKNCFLNDFPSEFLLYLSVHSMSIPVCCDADDEFNLLAWMYSIIKTFDIIKSENYSFNALSSDDIANIKSRAYFAESFDLKPFVSTFFEWIVEAVSTIGDFTMNNILPMILENKVEIISYAVIYTAVFSLLSYLSSDSPYQAQSIVPPHALKIIEKHNALNLSLHPSISKIARNMFECDVIVDGKRNKCITTISTRHIILPNHICLNNTEAYLVVYKNRTLNQIVIDNIKINRLFSDQVSDVAVWTLPKSYPSIFRTLVNQLGTPISNKTTLLHPLGALHLPHLNVRHVMNSFAYQLPNKTLNVLFQKDIMYDYDYNGLCGALVCSDDGFIGGMHVAGNSNGEGGAALMWSRETLAIIRNILQNDDGIKLNAEMSDKINPDSSCMKLTNNFHKSTPKESNYIPSPLYGVFPVSRVPAHLSIYGPHTVKDISKLARAPVEVVLDLEIAFGKRVVQAIFEPFNPISMKEVISGGDLLAGINKKSSNGHCEFKTKSECFDFINGEMTPTFEKAYNTFVAKILSRNIEVEDVLWVETLKDELRGVDKVTPRSFRVASVYIQVLTKKLFGGFVKNIVKNRDFNGIMVGINPFKDWQKLYDKLKNKPVWAGDVGKWDKKMLPQVEQAVMDTIMDNFSGTEDERFLAETLLLWHIHCITAVNDDTFMSTHSFPSGSFLTAIVNSIVNRFYKAMWFYRYTNCDSVRKFYDIVFDALYGDDTLNCLNDPHYANTLNAITMRDFFLSLGMTFTTSTKGEITQPFEDIKDITFLKRHFRFHSILGQIVGPLDLNTIYSGLSWVDSKKDVDQVMTDKISAFQREMFLHEYDYLDAINNLNARCLSINYPCTILTLSYLKQLYQSGDFDTEYNQKFSLLI
jgi:hypothetical protein